MGLSGHHDSAGTASNFSRSSGSQLPLLVSSTNYTPSLHARFNPSGNDSGSPAKYSSSNNKHHHHRGQRRRLIRYCSSKQQQLVQSSLGAALSALRWKLLLFIGVFSEYGRIRRKRWRINGRAVGKVLLSGLIFAVLGVGVPILNAVLVSCSDCEDSQQMPFEKLLDFAECTLSAISFLCLIHLLRRYGLRELLLIDDVSMDSPQVQDAYLAELRDLFFVLAKILLPFFVVELIHSILWFRDASVAALPLLHYQAGRKVLMCFLNMASWAYNNAMFLLMVLLFKIVCSLQLGRLQDYYKLLQQQQISDHDEEAQDGTESGNPGRPPTVLLILQEHIRLREQLLIISHRFRVFLVLTLLAITLSQFLILFQVTASAGTVNFRRTGDLVVCCSLQLVGVILCLKAAAKITHMAQRIVAVVSQWHAVASCASDQDIAVQRELLQPLNAETDVDADAGAQEDMADDEQKLQQEPVAGSFSFRNAINRESSTVIDVDQSHDDQYVLLEPHSATQRRFRRAVWPFLFLQRMVADRNSAAPELAAPATAPTPFSGTDLEVEDEFSDEYSDEALDEENDLRAALRLFRSTKDSLAGAGSFHKRHALVTYLQHCSTGISLYGFVLDRGCLYTIFAFELSIVLWTLGKTLILSS